MGIVLVDLHVVRCLRRAPLPRAISAHIMLAFRDHRHLRSPNVLCQDDGQPLSRQMVQYRMLRAARRAKLSQDGVHILRHTFARTWRCAAHRRERFRNWRDTGNWA